MGVVFEINCSTCKRCYVRERGRNARNTSERALHARNGYPKRSTEEHALMEHSGQQKSLKELQKQVRWIKEALLIHERLEQNNPRQRQRRGAEYLVA